jgi:hypothetical protein
VDAREGLNMEDLEREALRVLIYAQLATEGRVYSGEQLAARWQLTAAETARALEALATERHIVLDQRGEIELAHPFATRDFGFSVKSDRVLWWGGCAWDAFAISHLVPDASPALVATTCPACGTAHAWQVSRDIETAGTQLVHFLVPMAEVWDDVVHACENQSIFCDESCLAQWLSATGNERGATFDIPTLWRLSSDWYTGRLEAGYRRREPVAAADYFRSVGLVGAFWGNGD